MNALLLLNQYTSMPLDSAFLMDMLRDYRRPLDKVGEWVRQGYLVQLRRGLYAVGPELSHIKPEPFLVANHLYGPSYVSMESALSFWGFIPEQVVETVSMTAAKPHTYQAPMPSLEQRRWNSWNNGMPWWLLPTRRFAIWW